MTEIKVSEHRTPIFLSEEERQRARMNALECHFGDMITFCGFCGNYRHKHYVCSCGYDRGYAEENGPNGELIDVWFKVG